MANHSLGAIADSLAGRYTVERELGAGGMATVYLAHDVRHDRRVALKVLRPELAAVIGAERFLREIRTTANLQHPHILPLFDSGEAGSQLFYVMPLVEGESLRDRLDHEKQLGVEESVRIATEVASALDYAHRHGVVHRDVKPANILLHDGSALVSDFGIALAIRNAGADRITETGLSLGTPHYMSPEQATGDRDIGARSDIYSLAAVLYECLAGEPPHSGGTIQAVIAKVLTETPRPLGNLRSSVPVHVAMAVEQALAKVPADRFATAAAFADALKNPSATRSRGVGTTAAARRVAAGRPGKQGMLLGAAGLALGAALGWGLRRPAPPTLPPVVWFDIVADSGVSIADPPAISPDGSTIVYSAGGTDGATLYLRRLDELTDRQLSGTNGATLPFFSPDGKSIAFVSNNELRTLRLDGGAPISIARISQFFLGGTWAPDNTILFTQYPQAGLFRVKATGGPTERIGFGDDSSGFPNAPSMLPGGSAVLLAIDYGNGYELASFELATGSIKRLGRGHSPQFVAPDWLVFGRESRLFKQRFDVTTRDTIGGPEPILNSVNYDITTGIYFFGVGPSGTIAAVTGASSISDLTLVNRTGHRRVLFSARNTWAPRFSPDGRRIAYGAIASGKTQSDVWLYDLLSGNSQRLTLDAKESNDPVWSPTGREIMFSTTSDSSLKDIYVQSVDNLGSARLVLRRVGTQWNSDWSRDGRFMVFTDFADSSSWNIWSMSIGDTASAKPVLATSFQETAARLSPDGKWIAYHSDETGRMEVYVQSFPDLGNRILVSTDGGRDPVWRNDGRELYYWQTNRLITATLTIGSSVAVTKREPLFQLQTYVLGAHANYDVSPDGRSFAIVSGALASKVSVALNLVR